MRLDHTKPDSTRILRNAVVGVDGVKQNPPGTWIQYFEGDYSGQVGNTTIGHAAMQMHEAGHCLLVQKLLSNEPRRYAYFAVTK